jgi:hypothetical protein
MNNAIRTAAPLGLAAILLVSLCSGTPAHSDSTIKDTETPASEDTYTVLLESQLKYAAPLYKLGQQLADLGGSTDEWQPGQTRPVPGYLFQMSDLTEGSMDVYWKDSLPNQVQRVIQQYPELSVRVHLTEYDEEEFLTQQNVLRSAIESVLDGQDSLDAITHSNDRSRLIAHIVSQRGADDILDHLQEQNTKVSVPFSIEVSPEPYSVDLASRQNDSSPWSGL